VTEREKEREGLAAWRFVTLYSRLSVWSTAQALTGRSSVACASPGRGPAAGTTVLLMAGSKSVLPPKKTQYEREISPREQHPETLADARDAREVLGEIHQRRLASLRLGHALDGRHLKVAPRPRVCLLNEVGELMVACLTPLERLTRICWIVKRLAGSFSSTWSSQSPHKYAGLPARRKGILLCLLHEVDELGLHDTLPTGRLVLDRVVQNLCVQL
jgi:hypothetical protein